MQTRFKFQVYARLRLNITGSVATRLHIRDHSQASALVVLWIVMRKCCEKRPVLQEDFNLYLHIDKYVSCIIMGSVQLDVEGGICIVEMFSVEHVHLHLVSTLIVI